MAPVNTTLAALGNQFDTFLIDQFGVLLSGTGAYDFAPAALDGLWRRGATSLLLSNSGRRSAPNEARLSQLGFDPNSYLTVLSSGEAAHRLLRQELAQGRPIRKVGVLARASDRSIVEGLGVTVADSCDDIDLLIISGSDAETVSLEQYGDMMRPAAALQVPCWCVNPDITILTAQGKLFGAGRIARLYEEMGGAVRWIGKPHQTIYKQALEMLDGVEPDRILCIGDSPQHDIAGGQRAGMKTALVRTGIHADDDLATLETFFAATGCTPDFIIPEFSLPGRG